MKSKIIFAFILCLAVLLAFSACGKSSETSGTDTNAPSDSVPAAEESSADASAEDAQIEDEGSGSVYIKDGKIVFGNKDEAEPDVSEPDTAHNGMEPGTAKTDKKDTTSKTKNNETASAAKRSGGMINGGDNTEQDYSGKSSGKTEPRTAAGRTDNNDRTSTTKSSDTTKPSVTAKPDKPGTANDVPNTEGGYGGLFIPDPEL